MRDFDIGDNTFWSVLWLLITVFLSISVLSIASCEKETYLDRNQKIEDSLKAGVDANAAYCAFNGGGESSSALNVRCTAVAISKNQTTQGE